MPRGAVREVVVAVVFVLAVGCSGGSDRQAAPATSPPEREYWPTDDWRTADPANHGFDEDELAEIEQLAASHPNVRSVVIVRDGYLLYEHYWQGLSSEDGHDVRSVTKSVVSALVGIAQAHGAIESFDQTVGKLFADRIPADADPRMADVTIRQLLAMTAGLPGDDLSLGGDEGVWEQVAQAPDAVRGILGLPLAADPGSEWAYSSATSHLLSILVADTTGGSTLEFAGDHLFGPLGIDTSDAYVPSGPLFGVPPPEVLEQYARAPVAWPTDEQGYHFGGAFLKLPTRDLAKFGYLYLNDGRWDGEQVIPAEYVRDSTSPGERTPDGAADYGWQWWVPQQAEHAPFFARGYGGQVVYVDRALDLVVVVTSDPETGRWNADDLVEYAVVPAAGD
jgi:CubicO group peptidase (beta-lactamase class C family)